MALQSNLLAGDARLEACATSNPDHVTPGSAGPFVRKIQGAVMALDGTSIDQVELDAGRYGPSTAAAVLAYKQARDIINRTYQTQADNVVGIMTIKALDAELLANQVPVKPRGGAQCARICACRPGMQLSLAANALARAGTQVRPQPGHRLPPPEADYLATRFSAMFAGAPGGNLLPFSSPGLGRFGKAQG